MKHRFQPKGLKIGVLVGLAAIFLLSLLFLGSFASSQTVTSLPTESGTPAPSLATDQPVSAPINVDGSSYIGNPVDIQLGDTLEINLPSNAATGFSWQLIQISDPSILQYTGNTYAANSTPLPGAPGNESWLFKPLKSGTTSVLMQYSQPWTGGIKGAQSIAVTIIVE